MTPQEKAAELLVFYYSTASGLGEVETVFLKNNFEKLIKQMGGDTFYWSKAIDCALKCVDVVISETSDKGGMMGRGGLTDREYWTEVKTEILNHKL